MWFIHLSYVCCAVVLCKLTVSVRITAISVEATVVDEDDNDVVLGGDIDSGGIMLWRMESLCVLF